MIEPFQSSLLIYILNNRISCHIHGYFPVSKNVFMYQFFSIEVHILNGLNFIQ